MKKLKLILILLTFAVITLNAQTSEFRRNFSTTSGTPLSGYTNYIFLVPQANTYPTGALALTEDGTRDGVYYRANVPDGEYKIYIDADRGGAGLPTLYIERYWVGEQRISTIADHFDAADSYKLKGTGIKDGAITETKLGAGAVTETKLGNGSVTESKLGTGSVTNTKLGSNSITTDKLNADAVESTDIKDANVTFPKLSQAVVDYIDASGGGTITNNPDDITLETKPGSTIGVKDAWWALKQGKIDSLDKRTSNIVNVKEFGAVGDGTTEDSLAFQNALQYLYDNDGGTLYIPAGTYKISSILEIPNDGNGAIQQFVNKAIKIQGAGAWGSGNAMGTKPIGGTILDLRYRSSTRPFKIITVGTGSLEITGVCFTNKSATADSMEFIRVVGTTVYIHHNSFYGTQSGFDASNDAIVFGGAFQGNPRTADSSAYSGYGSMITENFFDYIRRFAVLYTWTNGICFTNNTIWNHCGTNISGGGAWESYGALNDNNNPNVGGVISGTLVEGGGYYTIFKLYNTGAMTFVGNNIYDELDSIRSVFDLSYGSSTNVIITGMHTDNKYPNNSVIVADVTSQGSALFNNHQSQESYWANPFVFKNDLRVRGSSLFFDNPSDATQNFVISKGFGSSPSFGVQYLDTNGVSPDDVFTIGFTAKTNTQLSLKGTGTIFSGGDINLHGNAASNNIYLGSDHKVRVTDGVIYNSTTTGTPPMGITSTTPVTNLTVQRIDTPTTTNMPSDSTGLSTGALWFNKSTGAVHRKF